MSKWGTLCGDLIKSTRSQIITFLLFFALNTLKLRDNLIIRTCICMRINALCTSAKHSMQILIYINALDNVICIVILYLK